MGRDTRWVRPKISRRQVLRGTGAAACTLIIPQWFWGCGEPEVEADPVEIDPAWSERVQTFESEGMILTEDEPGIWPGKEATHLPIVSFQPGQGVLEVLTNHEMTEEHWIQAHYLRDQRGRIVGFREFSPARDLLARASFRVPEGTTELTVFSFCNIHSTWRGDALDLTDVMGI